MTFADFLTRVRGPALVLVTLILLGQGQLFLGVIVAWTAYDTLRADTWFMGKLAALLASTKKGNPE